MAAPTNTYTEPHEYTVTLTIRPADWHFAYRVLAALYQTTRAQKLSTGIRLDALEPRLDRILDAMDSATLEASE